MAKLNRSNYPEGHNYLINGGFDIWQRGASTTAAHNAYSADRWKWIKDAGDTVTLSQSVTAPGYDAGTNALLIQAVAGGSTYSYFGQPIEDVQILSNTKIRVSAWLYPTGGMIGVTMYFYAEQQFGSGGSSAIAADTAAFVTVAGWQKISVTLDIPSVVGKTVGVGNNLFVTLQTPANTTGNLFVGKFKVQKGTRETPFMYRSNELELCQRYYEKSFRLSTAPAQAIGDYLGAVTGNGLGASMQIVIPCSWKTRKRGTPTVVTYNPIGASSQIQNAALATPFTGSGVSSNDETGCAFYGTTPAGTLGGHLCVVHYTAEAEL